MVRRLIPSRAATAASVGHVNQAHLPQRTDRCFDVLDRDPQQAGEIRPERRSAGDQRPIDPLGRRVDIDPDE
jgi:hypothetical protein